MVIIAVNVQGKDYSLTGSNVIEEPGDLVAAKQLLDHALGRNGAARPPLDRVELAAKLASELDVILYDEDKVHLSVNAAERIVEFMERAGALR